jgi:hypothetical protein
MNPLRSSPRSRMTPLAAFIAAAFALAAPEAFANTIQVTNCADDGSPGSLRSVIAGAVDGDTVEIVNVKCSTISLLLGQIEIPQDDLTIDVYSDESYLIISSNGEYAKDRIFHHTGTGTLTLSGLTLEDGKYSNPNTGAGSYSLGGCVYSAGSVAIYSSGLTGCHVTQASPDAGYASGGALFARGSVFLSQSYVTDSVASGTYVSGAGIVGNTVTVIDSVISGNSATSSSESAFGGGIVAYSAVVTNSLVEGNLVSQPAVTNGAFTPAGGGILATNLSLTASRVSYNSVSGSEAGGGILVKSSAVITGSTIDHNQSDYGGGGIYLEYSRSGPVFLTVSNSTISDNVSGSGGGISAFGNSSSGISVQNSTVAFNRSEYDGAGIKGSTITLHSTIVADNKNDDYSSDDLYVNAASASYSLVVSSNVALPGTVTACPRLQRLANTGGPTPTLALAHDSPAIDVGDNGAELEYDQRGDGYPRVVGAAADIGSWEWQRGPDDLVFHSGFESGCDE